MRRRRALRALKERRRELFHVMIQPGSPHPHTQGTWEALGFAIEMLERRGRCRSRHPDAGRCELPPDHGVLHVKVAPLQTWRWSG